MLYLREILVVPKQADNETGELPQITVLQFVLISYMEENLSPYIAA